MKKTTILFFLLLCSISVEIYSVEQEELPIVVVICSRNNEEWYKYNLNSVFVQDYSNYRVIYIDDASTDRTALLVENYINYHGIHDKITFIQNQERQYQLYNTWRAVHTCKDNEIITILDGDDFLAHKEVFKRVNKEYQAKDILMTYGQFKEYSSGKKGWCKQFPEKIVARKLYRHYRWISSHLRTFYAGLFKSIAQEDLMINGEFFKAGADLAAMFPMLEMADGRYSFIPDILYLYNRDRAGAAQPKHQSTTYKALRSYNIYETLEVFW